MPASIAASAVAFGFRHPRAFPSVTFAGMAGAGVVGKILMSAPGRNQPFFPRSPIVSPHDQKGKTVSESNGD